MLFLSLPSSFMGWGFERLYRNDHRWAVTFCVGSRAHPDEEVAYDLYRLEVVLWEWDVPGNCR